MIDDECRSVCLALIAQLVVAAAKRAGGGVHSLTAPLSPEMITL